MKRPQNKCNDISHVINNATKGKNIRIIFLISHNRYMTIIGKYMELIFVDNYRREIQQNIFGTYPCLFEIKTELIR